MLTLKDLENVLLSHGGLKVDLPDYEEDLNEIITRGTLWGSNSYLIDGEMCQGHKNSILYWKDNKNKCFFATGYALSPLGTWHQHSWLVTKKNEIIETTANRVKYFGYILNSIESNMFLSAYETKNH